MSDSPSDAMAAIISARICRDADGEFSTDSSSVYDVLALAGQVKHLFVHCFVTTRMSGRDPLTIPSNVTLVSLGDVVNGRELYSGAFSIASRLLRSAFSRTWSRAVIFQTGLVSMLAVLACGVARRRAIAVFRGDSAATAKTAQRYSRGAGRAIGLGLGWLHAVSRSLFVRTVPVVVDSHEMLDRVRISGSKAWLIPAGSISDDKVLHERSCWTGPADGPLKLLWVGRIELVKGLPLLLNAISMVCSSGRDICAEFVGSGDQQHLRQLLDLRSRLGLDKVVRFSGGIAHGDPLFAKYAASDILVLPSTSEGAPKVVIEAFAHGLPVVASRVGHLPGLVEGGRGILFPAGDAAALARTLAGLYDKPSEIASMSRSCLSAARTMSIERLAPQLAEAAAAARVPHWSGTRHPRTGR